MSNKLVVSLDVEDWYHGPSMISPTDPARSIEEVMGSGQTVERAHPYVDECLELLAESGIKATFFWVGEYANRYPELVKKVAAAGHEIACHGLSHYSKINSTTKEATFTNEALFERTKKAKDILEQITGNEVIGYRAPNAYVSGQLIDVLEEVGFKYDSSVSVNSQYNKSNSNLEGVATSAYYPKRGELSRGAEKRGIIEFPWPYLEMGNYKVQTAGGPFLRAFGSTLIKLGLRQSLKKDHSVFYFHPIDICREDIPLPFSMTRPLLWLLKGDMVKRRIRSVLKEFAPVATNFQELLSSVEIKNETDL